MGEGLLQTGLPSKEAAQLTDPGKDGISTRYCKDRVHLKDGPAGAGVYLEYGST